VHVTASVSSAIKGETKKANPESSQRTHLKKGMEGRGREDAKVRTASPYAGTGKKGKKNGSKICR